jgi:hypothetical protein
MDRCGSRHGLARAWKSFAPSIEAHPLPATVQAAANSISCFAHGDSTNVSTRVPLRRTSCGQVFARSPIGGRTHAGR